MSVKIYKILDQGAKPACQCYAIATLVSSLVRKLVDVDKLFSECDRCGGGTKFRLNL